jgi:hypothetical protein
MHLNWLTPEYVTYLTDRRPSPRIRWPKHPAKVR